MGGADLTDGGRNYVVIVWPTSEKEAAEDGADAYGPMSLEDALAARESVLRAAPDSGIDIALIHEVSALFAKFPLP